MYRVNAVKREAHYASNCSRLIWGLTRPFRPLLPESPSRSIARKAPIYCLLYQNSGRLTCPPRRAPINSDRTASIFFLTISGVGVERHPTPYPILALYRSGSGRICHFSSSMVSMRSMAGTSILNHDGNCFQVEKKGSAPFRWTLP
jgi:hypothetical protein